VIGVDVGGTSGTLARYEAGTWKEQERVSFTTAGKPFPVILESILQSLVTLRQPDTAAIGFGVPGPVTRDGTILTLPNIEGGEGVAIAPLVQEKMSLPCTVDNDSRCFAYAEAQEGAGKGRDVVVGITMGTGVGGGIVVHGTLLRGEHGFAGEIGHMLLQPGKPPYAADDARGDAEQFLSGTAMGKRCAEAKRPDDYLEGEVCSFLRPDLYREISWLCASLTHALDPSIIVFGGSAGRALKTHLNEIRKELPHWLLPKTPLPDLAVSTLKGPGCLGAALLAHAMVRRPA